VELAITEIDQFKIIKVCGKVDWENARILDRQIEQIIEDGYSSIVFNMEEVTFICSGGIGALVYNLNKVKRKGGAMYIISSNEYVNYIFETLKFDVVFKDFMFDSYDAFADRHLHGKKENA
jgi:anti-anti-sigma factor